MRIHCMNDFSMRKKIVHDCLAWGGLQLAGEKAQGSSLGCFNSEVLTEFVAIVAKQYILLLRFAPRQWVFSIKRKLLIMVLMGWWDSR